MPWQNLRKRHAIRAAGTAFVTVVALLPAAIADADAGQALRCNSADLRIPSNRADR